VIFTHAVDLVELTPTVLRAAVGSLFPLGTTTVKLQRDDDSGNVANGASPYGGGHTTRS